jgi:hypothetical protein
MFAELVLDVEAVHLKYTVPKAFVEFLFLLLQVALPLGPRPRARQECSSALAEN